MKPLPDLYLSWKENWYAQGAVEINQQKEQLCHQ
jgi:hypothetical protein